MQKNWFVKITSDVEEYVENVQQALKWGLVLGVA